MNMVLYLDLIFLILFFIMFYITKAILVYYILSDIFTHKPFTFHMYGEADTLTHGALSAEGTPQTLHWSSGLEFGFLQRVCVCVRRRWAAGSSARARLRVTENNMLKSIQLPTEGATYLQMKLICKMVKCHLVQS